MWVTTALVGAAWAAAFSGAISINSPLCSNGERTALLGAGSFLPRVSMPGTQSLDLSNIEVPESRALRTSADKISELVRGYDDDFDILFGPGHIFRGYAARNISALPKEWEGKCAAGFYNSTGRFGHGAPILEATSFADLYVALKEINALPQPLFVSHSGSTLYSLGEYQRVVRAPMHLSHTWVNQTPIVVLGESKFDSLDQGSDKVISGLCFVRVPDFLASGKEGILNKITSALSLSIRALDRIRLLFSPPAGPTPDRWGRPQTLKFTLSDHLRGFLSSVQQAAQRQYHDNAPYVSPWDISLWTALGKLASRALQELTNTGEIPIHVDSSTLRDALGNIGALPSLTSFHTSGRFSPGHLLGRVQVTLSNPLQIYKIFDTPDGHATVLQAKLLVGAFSATNVGKRQGTGFVLTSKAIPGCDIAPSGAKVCDIDFAHLGKIDACAQALLDGNPTSRLLHCPKGKATPGSLHTNPCAPERVTYVADPGETLSVNCNGETRDLPEGSRDAATITVNGLAKGSKCGLFSGRRLLYGDGKYPGEEDDQSLGDHVDRLTTVVKFSSLFSVTTTLLSILAIVLIGLKARQYLQPCLEFFRQRAAQGRPTPPAGPPQPNEPNDQVIELIRQDPAPVMDEGRRYRLAHYGFP